MQPARNVSELPWSLWIFFYGMSLLAALVLHLLCAHPYYFGDELFNFAMAEDAGRSFVSTYAKLNSYKPRLAFNGVWAFIAVQQPPRLFVMTASAAMLALALTSLLAISYKAHSQRKLWLGLLVVLAVATSRFGVMLPFDHVAGLIEYSSLAFLALALVQALQPGFIETGNRWTGGVVLALLTLAVLTHERYLAPVLALGGGFVVIGLVTRTKHLVWWGAIFAAIPACVFLGLTKLLAVVPLTTGTAGLPVTLGVDTIKAFAIYCASLLLSANVGYDWFFPKLAPGALPIVVSVLSTIALVGWLAGLRRERHTKEDALLGLVVLSLLAVACLPGTTRQEARWLFPAAAFFATLVARVGVSWSQLLLLAAAVISNITFLLLGKPDQIYNIAASKQARDLGLALNSVRPPGSVGVVLGAREPDISWALGGGNFGPGLTAAPGVMYSKINLPNGFYLFSKEQDVRERHGRPPDFGVVRAGDSHAYIPSNVLRAISNPSDLDLRQLQQLGGDNHWRGWTLRGLQPDPAGRLILRAEGDGFFEVPATALDGRVLVYRMKALEGAPTRARLQVNWMGTDDQLLAAPITVVDVAPDPRNFATFLVAPAGAKSGLVYVTLDTPSSAKVHVQFVGLSN